MKIQLQLKQSYGRDLIYPVCEKSKALAKLVGQKTITEENLHIITKELGYNIEWVPRSIDLGS